MFNCRIRDTELGKGTFACKDFEMEEVICSLSGEVVSAPTVYTLQISPTEHVVPLFGKYLNHSCQPNCYFHHGDRTFRALTFIADGDEITFDYCTTEYAMAAPFECHCGSANCYHVVQGYKFLPQNAKERIYKYVPSYFFEK